MYVNYDMTHKKTKKLKAKSWMLSRLGGFRHEMDLPFHLDAKDSLLCCVLWKHLSTPLKMCEHSWKLRYYPGLRLPTGGLMWIYPLDADPLRWVTASLSMTEGSDKINWWLVIWRRYVAPCLQIWAHQALPTSWLLYALDLHHRTHLDVSWSQMVRFFPWLAGIVHLCNSESKHFLIHLKINWWPSTWTRCVFGWFG